MEYDNKAAGSVGKPQPHKRLDFFDSLTPETVFPEQVYRRMQGREKAFVLFLKTNRVYSREMYDIWVAEHGLDDGTPRLTYLYVKKDGMGGYIVNHGVSMKSVMVPEDLLSGTYTEFMGNI